MRRCQDPDKKLAGAYAYHPDADVVANRPGLAYVGRESGVFSDGIYELAVGTAAGDLRWYVEVSAHGIAWGG